MPFFQEVPVVLPLVSVKQSIEKTTTGKMVLPTSDDAAGGKKSRSQRRKQARRNALQNGTADEPLEDTNVQTSHIVSKVEGTTKKLQVHPPTTPYRYAYLNAETKVTLITPSGEKDVIRNAPTLEVAVKALIRAAPPNTVKGVFIVNDPGFVQWRRSVDAVQKAGYTNVKVIETFGLSITTVIYKVPLQQTIGTIIFVFYGSGVGDLSKPPMDVVTILQKRERGWQLLKLKNMYLAVDKFPSAKEIVVFKETATERANLQRLLPGFKFHFVKSLPPSFTTTTFIRNRINGDDFCGNEVLPYCWYDLEVQFGGSSDIIPLTQNVPPFSKTQEVCVGDATTIEIHAFDRGYYEKTFVKSFKFETAELRVVSVTVHVDETLVPQVTLKSLTIGDARNVLPDTSALNLESAASLMQAFKKVTDGEVSLPTSNDTAGGKKSRSQRRRQARRNALQNGTADVSTSRDNDVDTGGSMTTLPEELSQLQLDPPPTTILTFTSDNRVLIKADETYTGVTQLLAYVRLQAGTAPIIGQQAFDALKTHPESVFYAITRLMATDFDPAYSDPSWRFKTTRDADGKLVIHGGGDIVTLPIVLFGLVVNSTLLYIKEHQKSEVTELGIRLPLGSVISDSDLKAVSKKIGVKLIVVGDKL
uniref:ATP-dependent DNA helicase n=1 Tax=Panagrellus redivivus TaxID=6233 RepID=A0A7E4V6H6_PANRE